MATVARPRRQKKCKVCNHRERDLIEGGMLSGWSARGVTKRVGNLTRRDIRSHTKNCIEKKTGEEKECR